MEDSVICEIESRQFRRLISEQPDLAFKYIELVTGRLKEMEELLEYMAYGSVRQRLLFLLQKLAAKFSPDSKAAGMGPARDRAYPSGAGNHDRQHTRNRNADTQSAGI